MNMSESNHDELCLESPDSFELQRIRRSLEQCGWGVSDQCELGVERLCEELATKSAVAGYFGPEVKGYPIKRMRTRDVIEYRRRGGEVILNEFHTVTLRPRTDVPLKTRTHQRAYMLEYPALTAFISAFLAAVPVGERKEHGTIGLDMMRTFGDVVPRPHQDEEEFTAICVVTREGKGATTRLFKVDDREEMAAGITLGRGDVLFFRDRDFVHDATRLLPRFDGDHEQYRDALIVTLHYYDSYLGATWNVESMEDLSDYEN